MARPSGLAVGCVFDAVPGESTSPAPVRTMVLDCWPSGVWSGGPLLGSSGDEDVFVGGVIVASGASRKARCCWNRRKRNSNCGPVTLAVG